jgi:hypothetical protein
MKKEKERNIVKIIDYKKQRKDRKLASETPSSELMQQRGQKNIVVSKLLPKMIDFWISFWK